MKRSQRWSVDSDVEPGHRRSQAGPFRRRRALRHLDTLAQHPARELSETVGVAHVRVIGDADGQPSAPRTGALPAPLPVVVAVPPTTGGEEPSETPGAGAERARNASDRFHAVPIDEELGVSLLPAVRQR